MTESFADMDKRIQREMRDEEIDEGIIPAARAPVTEPQETAPTVSAAALQCLVCKETYDTSGQQCRSPWQISIAGANDIHKHVICRRCVQAGHEARKKENER